MISDPALAKKDKLMIVNWLIENFPSTFFKKATDVKPLQIGIFEDILDFYERLESPPFSKKSIKETLRFYSNSPAYLKAQQEGASRVDIFGNEIDVVTKEQAKYARQRFQERYARKEEVK
jgi:ProP effector